MKQEKEDLLLLNASAFFDFRRGWNLWDEKICEKQICEELRSSRASRLMTFSISKVGFASLLIVEVLRNLSDVEFSISKVGFAPLLIVEVLRNLSDVESSFYFLHAGSVQSVFRILKQRAKRMRKLSILTNHIIHKAHGRIYPGTS
jgi:hypothetical protein